MSIIARLLAGNTGQATNLSHVRTLIGGNKAEKQVRKFAASAAKSEVGGSGTGFDSMTGAQQSEFILGNTTHVAKQLRKNYSGPPTTRTPPASPPASPPKPAPRHRMSSGETSTPQEKMARHDRTIGGPDSKPILQQASSTPSTPRGSLFKSTLPDSTRRSIAEQAVEAAPSAPFDRAYRIWGDDPAGSPTSMDDIMSRAPKKKNRAPKLGSSSPRSALSPDMPRSTESGDGILKQAASAVGKAGRATEEAAMNAYQGSGLQKVMNVLGGDTSGKAAANAGDEFMAGAERVFAGDAGKAVSGLEGDGASDILKEAWKATDDDAFKAVLTKGGASDDAVTNLSAFRSEIKKVDNEGGQLSEEGMSAMMKNQGELGEMYGGFSRAGASASPNALLRAIGGESGHGFGDAMGIAAVAGLAGGANVAMGGDFTEGAAVGGGIAFGARAIAKGVAGSMGDIENSMVKSILGDEKPMEKIMTDTGTTKELIPGGTKLSEISKNYDDRLLSDIYAPDQLTNQGAEVGATIGQARGNATHNVTGGLSTKTKTALTEPIMKESEVALTGGAARRQQLETIAGMKDNDERLQGFGKKKMRDLLNPEKERNVAMNNRLLTLGGGMLAGVAFTGQSDKRNYRRGFNAHRGNRI